MDRITDNIYIGSQRDAERIATQSQQKNTDTLPFIILTVADNSNYRGAHYFPLSDAGDQPHDYEYFVAAIDYMIQLRGQYTKNNILVHCVSGWNRSVAVVLAFLTKTTTLHVAEVFLTIKEQRPIVYPNANWRTHLGTYLGVDIDEEFKILDIPIKQYMTNYVMKKHKCPSCEQPLADIKDTCKTCGWYYK